MARDPQDAGGVPQAHAGGGPYLPGKVFVTVAVLPSVPVASEPAAPGISSCSASGRWVSPRRLRPHHSHVLGPGHQRTGSSPK